MVSESLPRVPAYYVLEVEIFKKFHFGDYLHPLSCHLVIINFVKTFFLFLKNPLSNTRNTPSVSDMGN